MSELRLIVKVFWPFEPRRLFGHWLKIYGITFHFIVSTCLELLSLFLLLLSLLFFLLILLFSLLVFFFYCYYYDDHYY